jgi:hypothetical protein
LGFIRNDAVSFVAELLELQKDALAYLSPCFCAGSLAHLILDERLDIGKPTHRDNDLLEVTHLGTDAFLVGPKDIEKSVPQIAERGQLDLSVKVSVRCIDQWQVENCTHEGVSCPW